MNSTISAMLTDMVTFFILFVIILSCFACAGVYFFGDALDDFVTFSRAVVRMFQVCRHAHARSIVPLFTAAFSSSICKRVALSQITMSMTDYNDMKVIDSSFGFFAPFFYFIIMLLLWLLLLNMMLAVILGAYDQVRAHQAMIDKVYRNQIDAPVFMEFLMPLMYFDIGFPFEYQMLKALKNHHIVEDIIRCISETGVFAASQHLRCPCLAGVMLASAIRLHPILCNHACLY